MADGQGEAGSRDSEESFACGVSWAAPVIRPYGRHAWSFIIAT
ncbi:MAG: hypothetical protein WBG24_00250 [Syntrophobacteria bacterium]